MSDKIRYYDKTGRDITAQVEANAAMEAAQLPLRDFFAGCALIGCIIKDDIDVAECPVAYAMADAMLRARESE